LYKIKKLQTKKAILIGFLIFDIVSIFKKDFIQKNQRYLILF